MQAIKCIIITIGDELLIGQTIDTNSAWIAQQLNPIGILVVRRIAVGDIKQDIIDALDESKKIADVIIITGGLGPTADDITKPLLCEYFGGNMIENKEVLSHVSNYFVKRNRPLLESNLKQALVPDVCEVLFNEVGTAPGMLFREENKIIVSLPGVPFEMQHIVSTHLIDLLKNQFKVPTIIHKTLLTSGEGESFIADRLTDFEKELPAKIKLAYLPKLNIVKLRLTAIDVAESEVQKYFDILKKILAHIAVGEGDFELEEIIAQLLIQKNKTVSVAESCTGGQVASRLTSIKGSSAYFKGGIVPYSIKSKISVLGVDASIIENTSVVSKETVLDMAKKCRIKFNTDYAVSASGYLEKNDNGNIVWIGMASENRTIAKKIVVPYDREKNTVFASNTMLNALRIFILED